MRLLAWLPIVCVAACAPPPVPALPPPQPATLTAVKKDLAVLVRGGPDVSSFKPVLERALGRAGFRVITEGPGDTLVLSLIGGGYGTSGANGGGSSVRQALSVDMSASVNGRLSNEYKSAVSYVASYDRGDAKDSFEAFNQRVADYNRAALEWLAADLTNKLIASLE